ncbi:MAG: type II toxin-antitoxin system HigB family toxin [Verrucomicrobia bacterium]|nr:type II toxin-antitoxin system HigB family toxin [Verrucomicrobiota bacterium]
MIVIGRKKLDKFKRKHADARGQVDAWLNETRGATWQTPKDIKTRYPHASILAGNRVLFNIKGRSYRLVVVVRYVSGAVLIEWVGTHAEYDRLRFE